MKKTNDYHKTLIKNLKDPLEAAEYLNVTFEQGDLEMFLVALRNVAEAHGGMMRLSRVIRRNRSNLYKLLSKHGNPEMRTLTDILKIFGLKFVISVKDARSSHPVRRAA